jgi:hypothetical protein
MVNVSTARKLSILGRVVLDRTGRNRTVGALLQAGKTTLGHFGKVLHILWLEVTGFIFLGLGGIAGYALYREYAHYQAGDIGPGRVLLTAAVAVMFVWFGLNSFWRSRRK